VRMKPVVVQSLVHAVQPQLVSWAGLCPQLRESAGKSKSTRVGKEAPWVKPVLVQAAWSAVRKKGSHLPTRELGAFRLSSGATVGGRGMVGLPGGVRQKGRRLWSSFQERAR
jgi:transposase